MAGLTLAEVFKRFGPALLAQWHAQGRELSASQARAWAGITACRTPALGGSLLRCEDCHAEQWRWHSCRNRHCPQCQSRQREAWRRARGAELLNVPYGHLVFTLPHTFNGLASAQPRWIGSTLLDAVAATLTQFAADPRWLGGIGAFTLVLHTWTQTLGLHLHVHALMACGALAHDAHGQPYWQAPRRSPTFLFPVRALGAVFRGHFLERLQALPPRRPGAPLVLEPLLREARRHDWVVYAKTPLAGPAAVLDYLSRYTHRTAIGHERLVAIQGDDVLFRARAQRTRRGARHADAPDMPRKRTVRMSGPDFIAHFLQHVVPLGFKRIRHYGLLAPGAKTRRMACARALLGMPAANPAIAEDVAQFMRRVAAIDILRCSHCRQGAWRAVLCQLPDRTAAHPAAPPAPSGAGPPGVRR